MSTIALINILQFDVWVSRPFVVRSVNSTTIRHWIDAFAQV